MKTVFADTAYWIALLNPHDTLHEKARAVSLSLGAARLVTSEMVLTELLNDLGSRGELLRRIAVTLVPQLRQDPEISVVPQSTEQFVEALSLFEVRNDKDWSLTDCASFCTMGQKGITEALTYDRHFEQAGFKALLRD